MQGFVGSVVGVFGVTRIGYTQAYSLKQPESYVTDAQRFKGKPLRLNNGLLSLCQLIFYNKTKLL